ncbi:MAG: AraC family transcriptional regulator [Eubacteriales bacterium]|nr:AraC family transcriptional regulator [Eubacteriales bacterium]
MKKKEEASIKYASLSNRKGDRNTILNDFTLTPPTNTQLVVCQSGHKSFTPSGWHTRLNTYDHYILHYILTGQGTYYAPSGVYPVKAGELFLIKPAESIHYQADYSFPWTYYWVGFNGASVRSILNLCGFSDTTLVRSCSLEEQLKETMHGLAYPGFSDISREYELLAGLCRLFSLLIHTHIHEPLSKSVQYLNAAVEFIQLRCSYSDLRVSDVAEYVGIDRTYLYRIFYESFQMSVQDFILDLRLKKARNFLKYSDAPISLIAFNCGFENQSYFSTVFKKKFHVSPLQYRKGAAGPQI